MAEFRSEFKFDIDDGELEHVSRAVAFVLGFELGLLYQLAQQGTAYQGVVHADNRERIARLCAKFGRTLALRWSPADRSEDWLEMTMGAGPPAV